MLRYVKETETQRNGMDCVKINDGVKLDNLIQIELITANLSHVVAQKNGTKFVDEDYWNDNNDLYWALRGGGGGTFGVVLNFYQMIHETKNKRAY